MATEKAPHQPTNSKLSAFLQKALDDLKRKNDALSLRAVAKKIGISPSYLSKIINGHKRLPPSLLGKFTEALHLDHLRVKDLQSLVIADIEEKLIEPETGLSSIAVSRSQSMSEFEVLNTKEHWMLEKWYYIAILNLVTLKDFEASPKWIADRLGISETQARNAFGSLLAHGYLKKDENAQVVRTDQKVRFPTNKSHPLVRSYHAQHLRKALQMLEREDTEKHFDDRLIAGISLAGDRRKLKTAKAMIHEALYKAAEYLADGECDDVFHLSIQLMPVTRD